MDNLSGYVSLLLSMNGNNDSTIFTDSSLYGKTVTANGNACIKTAQYKWNGSSGYFDGNGDYLSIPHDSTFEFLSGGFSIECWARFSSASGEQGLYSKFLSVPALNGVNIRYSAANSGFRCVFCSGGSVDAWNFTWSPSINTWYHLVFQRFGNSFYVFVDGTQLGSTQTFSNAVTIGETATASVNIGFAQTVENAYFNGYMQDMRITKTWPRYSGNFTAPAASFEAPENSVIELFDPPLIIDAWDGGNYRILGTVTELGLAGSYRVRLFERESGRLIRETWSNTAGTYAFNNIAYRANGYFVVAYDHGDNPLNAAIADLVTPESMP